MLAPCPAPELEDHPLSAARDFLFNIFTATLHTGGRSSIRKLSMRRAVVTGTDLSWTKYLEMDKINNNLHNLFLWRILFDQ